MPHQANTDPQLAEAGHRQRASGVRLLLIGGILLAIGLVILLLGAGGDVMTYVGVALMTLGAPPVIAGLGLVLSGVVSGRASQRKPFA